MSHSERLVSKRGKHSGERRKKSGERLLESREQPQERVVRERPITRQSVRLKRSAESYRSPQSSGASSSAGSGQDQDVSSREEAMKKYMRVALSSKRKKKKSVTTGSKVSPEKTAAEKALSNYLMISVGKMNYDFKKQKGIHDRAFVPIKIPLHKDSTHSEVLNKCINQVWKEAPEGVCYLADGSGSKISGDDISLSLREGDGGPMTIPWNLSNYIKVSGASFPSRVRLYCVNIHGQTDENEASLSHSGDLPKTPSIDSQESAAVEEPLHGSNSPVGYFRVSYLEKVPSRYTSNVSFRGGNQESILSSRIDDYIRMQEVEESLIESPSYRIFLENPLQLGFFLDSITTDQEDKYNFIETMDCVTGNVCYKMPEEGSSFQIWSGCYCSIHDRLAIMACPAINGYHGVATYCWQGTDTTLSGEETPILIAGVGRYKCLVTARESVLSQEFVVTEQDGVIRVKKVALTEDGGKVSEVASTTAAEIVKPEQIPKSDLEAQKSSVASNEELKKLRILEEIGQGNFGRVYKAIWRGTIVAAKEVRLAGNQKILENEMSVYRSLNHPNLLSLLGTVSQPFSMTLLTNYVKGKTLHALVFDSEIQLTYKEKVMVSRQLCQALVFMHSAVPPIAHLDVKPENVLVEEGTLHVYLGDFGLGKVMTGTRIFNNAGRNSRVPIS